MGRLALAATRVCVICWSASWVAAQAVNLDNVTGKPETTNFTISATDASWKVGNTSEAFAVRNLTDASELSERETHDDAGAPGDFAKNPTTVSKGALDAVQARVIGEKMTEGDSTIESTSSRETELSSVGTQGGAVLQAHTQASLVDVTLGAAPTPSVFYQTTTVGHTKTLYCAKLQHLFINYATWYATGSGAGECRDYDVTKEVRAKCHRKESCVLEPLATSSSDTSGSKLPLGNYCNGKVKTLSIAGDCRSPCFERNCLGGECKALTATTTRCDCKTGYMYDGAKCVPNPCYPRPCGRGTCFAQTTRYSYMCKCHWGFQFFSETCRRTEVKDVINLLSKRGVSVAVKCRKSESLRITYGVWYGLEADCRGYIDPVPQLRERCENKQVCDFTPFQKAEKNNSLIVGFGRVCSKSPELLAVTFECWG